MDFLIVKVDFQILLFLSLFFICYRTECGCSCQGSLDEGKTCTSQGTCFCKTGYQGDKCELCTEGYHLSGNNLLEECVGNYYIFA